MILILDDYGIALSQENECFKIEKGDSVRIISPSKLTGIQIHKPCQLSSAALILAMTHQISVVLMNHTAYPTVRISSSTMRNHATIRRHQVHFTTSIDGYEWMRGSLNLKFDGIISNLAWLCHRTPSMKIPIEQTSEKINLQREKLRNIVHPTATQLRTIEAIIGKYYWQILSKAMRPYTSFSGRSQHPATDPFNAVLNYMYGMLYNTVDTACHTAGLDSQIGILHIDDYNARSFVYDSIEPFRPWIDKKVMALFMKKELDEVAGFDQTEHKCMITEVIKRPIIKSYIHLMEEKTFFNEKRVKRRDQIQHLHSKLAQYLLKEFKIK